MIIDAYTHFTPAKLLYNLARSGSQEAENAAIHMSGIQKRFPSFNSVRERIDQMDRYGIDMQVSNVHCIIEPNIFDMQESTRKEIVSDVNREFSALSDSSDGRILGIGTPCFGPDLSCDMDLIDVAVDELGLKGFMVPTNIRGNPVDKYTSFWTRMNELELPVFLHPVDFPAGQARSYELDLDLMHVLGWPYETALILTRMALRGFTSRFPNLRVISHHMGGNATFLLGRISESYDGKTPTVGDDENRNVKTVYDLREAFRHFYYDTAIGGSEESVKHGFSAYGAERIVFATDYPWGPDGGRQRLETYPGVMRDAIPEEHWNSIFEWNIKNLLKL